MALPEAFIRRRMVGIAAAVRHPHAATGAQHRVECGGQAAGRPPDLKGSDDAAAGRVEHRVQHARRRCGRFALANGFGQLAIASAPIFIGQGLRFIGDSPEQVYTVSP